MQCRLDAALLRARMRLIVNLQHVLHRELRVALRGRQALVAEQLLNGAQVGAFFQHVRTESVAQRVRMNVRRKPFGDGNFLDDAADAARGEPAAAPVDEQARSCACGCSPEVSGAREDRLPARLSPNRRTEHSVLFFPCRESESPRHSGRMSSRLIPVSSELRMPHP